MPIDPITGAAVVTAIGAGANALSTGNMNRRNRRHQIEMYERTFRDNIRFWEMQNEYNDPSAQMERLRRAGINPHMIAGNPSAVGNAGNIQSPNVQPYQHQAADFSGFGNAARNMIHDIADIDIKRAQVDNMKVDMTNKIKQGLLLDVEHGQKKFDYKFARKLEAVNADILHQQLLNMQADRTYTLGKNEREIAMNGQNIFESLERIYKYRAETDKIYAERRVAQAKLENLYQDTRLKRLSAEMKELGIEPGDVWYFRVLARELNSGQMRNVARRALPRWMRE
jgi:hypothetical protein